MALLSGMDAVAQSWNSSVVYADEEGRFMYFSDEEGNRIPDFGYAGYRGGGVDLPEIPSVVVLNPSGSGDDTDQIQQALDMVGGMEPDSEGYRGAVMLNAGTYRISAPLVIGHSGVVLRGAGSGADPAENTVIIAAKEVGEISDVVIRVGNGATNWSSAEGSPVTEVVTEWVPVGNRTMEVASSDGFAAGDDIILHHPASQAWIDVVDGGAPDDPLLAASWMPSESNLDIVMKRTISEVRGNLLVLDVPVFTHLRRDLSVVSVYKPDLSTEIRECGVEDFRLVLESDGETSTSHGFNALMFDGVENCWADGVVVLHFQKTGIGTMNSRFVTIQNAAALEPHAPID
ncbi:MAG: peptidoglycan-binding protein, partial [Balneolaceae bacterium]